MLFLKILQSVTLKGLNILLVMCASVLCARLMGAEEFGRYSSIMAAVVLLSTIAQMGLPSLIVREIARFTQNRQWDAIRGLLLWGGRTMSLAIFAVMAGFFAYYLLESCAAERSFGSWAFAALSIIVLVLASLFSAAIRGVRAVVWGQVPERIVTPTVFVALIASTAFFFGDVSAEKGVVLYFFASASALLSAIVIIKLVGPREIFISRTFIAVDQLKWKKALLPFAFVSIAQALSAQIGIILLGFYSVEQEVGLFRAAEQVAALVAFVMTSAAAVLEPLFSKHWADHNLNKLKSRLDIATSLGVLFSLPLVASFILYPSWVLEMAFGADFVLADKALRILTLGQLVNVLAGPTGVLLNMTGHERVMVRAIGLSAAVGVIAAFMLIPHYGGLGAAVASAMALVVWNIYTAISVYYRLGIKVSAWRWIVGN